jgi:predicted GNAT family acetyltransferase
VVALCPFATDYIRRHQEYADLVHPEYRARITA